MNIFEGGLTLFGLIMLILFGVSRSKEDGILHGCSLKIGVVTLICCVLYPVIFFYNVSTLVPDGYYNVVAEVAYGKYTKYEKIKIEVFELEYEYLTNESTETTYSQVYVPVEIYWSNGSRTKFDRDAVDFAHLGHKSGGYGQDEVNYTILVKKTDLNLSYSDQLKALNTGSILSLLAELGFILSSIMIFKSYLQKNPN